MTSCDADPVAAQARVDLDLDGPRRDDVEAGGPPGRVLRGLQDERLPQLVRPEQLLRELPPAGVDVRVRVHQPPRVRRRARADEVRRHRREDAGVQVDGGPGGIRQLLDVRPGRGRPLGGPPRPRRGDDPVHPAAGRRVRPGDLDAVRVAGGRRRRADGPGVGSGRDGVVRFVRRTDRPGLQEVVQPAHGAAILMHGGDWCGPVRGDEGPHHGADQVRRALLDEVQAPR